MQQSKVTYKDWHDTSLRQIQRKYQLEPNSLYFLTLFLNEAGDFKGKYSFDVEAANDSHYQFTTKEEAGIRGALGALDDESLVDCMARYLKTHSGRQLEAIVEFRCTKAFHYN